MNLISKCLSIILASGCLLISSMTISQSTPIDSIVVYGLVSTSRLQGIQDYWRVRDSLVSLGNHPNAIRLHGRLFDECFRVNDDLSIVKGSLLIGEMFYSNGKHDVLCINPIGKGVSILMQPENYLPTDEFKKEWEDALLFFHPNRLRIP